MSTPAPASAPAPVPAAAAASQGPFPGAPAQIEVLKGHGSGNDFVLVPDHDGALELGPALVAALADRHRGLGADGVIRVVRSRALPEGAAALAEDPGAEWFMDYRNADGSIAEMCGNGVRVLVEHLVTEGLVDPAALPGGVVPVGTRGGVKRVTRAVGPAGEPWWATDMGAWALLDPGAAERRGADALVEVAGLDVARPALSLDLGNPHTVVMLAEDAELEAADLTRPPAVDPLPPHGTNVELIVPVDAVHHGDDPAVTGRLRMRVHERGVGETLSCGTGICAAALAARTWAGAGAPDHWLVEVPGGTLAVRTLPGGRVELAGPARIVARARVVTASLA